jgi:hypothetical protein
MAQTGYTPIQLYYSTTVSQAPLAASLANGELAINITDGKLFYKDNANAVQVIGWKTVPVSAGGTGLTSLTANGILYASSSSSMATGSLLSFNGTTFAAPNSVITSSSSSDALKITQTGAGNALLVEDANPDSSPFVIDAIGNVGIGSTTATYPLDVTGITRLNGVVGINGTPSASASLLVSQGGADFTLGTNYATLISGNSYSGGIALNATSMQIGQNSANRSLTFHSGTSFAERMRVSPVGNVLIGGTATRGTTVGASHLDIFNGTAPAGTLTNGISLYSLAGDFYFMDAAGTQYEVGFRNIPPVGTKTGSYTLAVADVGKYVQVGTGGSITIPDATFAEGDVISLFNNTTGNITITCTITTAYIGGVNTDRATVTLATRGVATIFFISGTVCVINGNVS